ncbi:hypothetical protein ACFL2R_00075 [Patescibacteria group bacterium]
MITFLKILTVMMVFFGIIIARRFRAHKYETFFAKSLACFVGIAIPISLFNMLVYTWHLKEALGSFFFFVNYFVFTLSIIAFIGFIVRANLVFFRSTMFGLVVYFVQGGIFGVVVDYAMLSLITG